MARGILITALAALLFAGKGIVIKYLYTLNASVDEVMILRMLFSIPLYVVVGLWFWRGNAEKLSPSNLLGISVIGALGYYVASYLDLYGLQFVSAALERIILYTYPAFVLIFSVLFLRQPASRTLWLCVAVIYIGLMLVVKADIDLNPQAPLQTTLYGSLFIFLSAISFAFYVIGSSHYMQVFSSLFFTSLAMLAAGMCMVVHYAVRADFADLLNLSAPIYLWSLLNAVVFTVLPTFLMSIGIRQIGAGRAGAVGMIGPLGTVVIAAIALAEPVSALQILGFVLVLAGIHRLQRS